MANMIKILIPSVILIIMSLYLLSDNVPPTVTCPQSRTEYIDLTDGQTKDITTALPSAIAASDTVPSGAGGTAPTVVVNPQTITVSNNNLNQVYTISVTATDAVNLQDSCSFEILVRGTSY